MTTYRDETETLRQKLEGQEREIESLLSELAAARTHRWSERWHTFRIWTAFGFTVALVGLAGVYGMRVQQTQQDAEHAARVAVHEQRLERLRHWCPESLTDCDLWRWCVDHCQRAGSPGGSVQGIVTAVFDHYGFDGQPTQWITVRGPWLFGRELEVVSIAVSGDVHVNDLVSIYHLGFDDRTVSVLASPLPPR